MGVGETFLLSASVFLASWCQVWLGGLRFKEREVLGNGLRVEQEGAAVGFRGSTKALAPAGSGRGHGGFTKKEKDARPQIHPILPEEKLTDSGGIEAKLHV